MSYTASLMPPDEKLADPDWKNPDFPNYSRTWRPDPTQERRVRTRAQVRGNPAARPVPEQTPQ